MYEKPSYVLAFKRPKNTEIKRIRDNWYLYERTSKYDPAIKRSRKISGKCLGRITEQGLVPTQRRLVNQDAIRSCSSMVSDTVEIGASLFLYDRTTEIRERLQRYFPDLWERIYVSVLLRTIKGPRFKRLQLHYETNFLAYLFPNLSFDPLSNSEFLQTLGRRREAISDFMKQDVKQDNAFILFDGHRLITSSKTMPLAELGYDSKRRYMPQVNLLYIYSLGQDSGLPVYYKQFLGSTPDVSAFPNILVESGLSKSNYTIVADKGFASEYDFDQLAEQNLNYIIPIKRGSSIVGQILPLSPNKFSDLFIYNGRAVQSLRIQQEDYNIFVFFDSQLYADELADATERMQKKNAATDRKLQTELKRRGKSKGRLTDQELSKLQPIDLQTLFAECPEMGTVTMRTNRMDLNSHQVYRAYKQRQAVEQFFKTYGETMDYEASYMRDQTSQEAWLFLNHLSAMIATECIADIARLGEDKNISFDDLRQTLGKIMANKIDGHWTVAPIKKSVASLMEKLKFSMDAINPDQMVNKDRSPS